MVGRPIPGNPAKCGRCGEPVTWARTTATENGPGRKPMPLNPIEDLEHGNTAVRPIGGGRLVARVLKKDETHDREVEYLAVPHFATCQPTLPVTPAGLPPNVIDLTQRRRSRR